MRPSQARQPQTVHSDNPQRCPAMITARLCIQSHVNAAVNAASLTRQLSNLPHGSGWTSSNPARANDPAAFSTTSRDNDVAFISPNGVM